MYLRRVVVENFRGIRRVEMELDKSTVLIGENNAGKSTVVDAIRLCLERPLSRRGTIFDDYDHHLCDGAASFSEAPPASITLDFLRTGRTNGRTELSRPSTASSAWTPKTGIT